MKFVVGVGHFKYKSVVYFLVAFGIFFQPTPSHGLSYTCFKYFYENKGSLQSVQYPKRSSIFNARWILNHLFKKGQYQLLLNANPKVDHSEFLAYTLQEAIVQLRDQISRDGQGAYSDVSDLFPQNLIGKFLKMMGLSTAKYEDPRNRFQTISEDYDSYTQRRIHYFLFLEKIVEEKLKARAVTAFFFQTATHWMQKIYSKSMANHILVEESYMALMFEKDLAKIEQTSKGRDSLYTSTSIPLDVFSELSPYDLIEFYPLVYPKGTFFKLELNFDENTKEDSNAFANHDDRHSLRIKSAFDALTPQEMELYLKIRRYLITKRAMLTPEDEMVAGSVLNHIVHEEYTPWKIIEMFQADYDITKDKKLNSPAVNLDGVVHHGMMGRLHFYFIRDFKRDHGFGIEKSPYALLHSFPYFQKRAWELLEEMKLEYLNSNI